MRRKRFLWVVGSADRNLGDCLREMALDLRDCKGVGHYVRVYATGEMDGDVNDHQQLLEKIRQFKRENPLAGIDVAYCAGYNQLSPIGSIEESDLWNSFSVNVMGFVRLMKCLVMEYAETRVNVVAVASDAARTPMRNSIAYCSSKAALVQAMRVAARELAPHFRVNAISPAIIDDTPMTLNIDVEVQQQRGWTYQEMIDYEKTMIPMGRRAQKHEVARLILETLNGPEFLTGSNIEITGGK